MAKLALMQSWMKAHEGYWVVRCGDTELMGFGSSFVKAIEGTRIVFDKDAPVAHITLTSAMDDSARSALANLLMVPWGRNKGGIDVTYTGRGVVNGSVVQTPSPACEAQEVLRTPNSKEEFERPRDFVYVNAVGGDKPGGITFERRKNAPKLIAKSGCSIRKPATNPLLMPLPADLETLFYDQLLTNMKKSFGTAEFVDDVKPTRTGCMLVIEQLVTGSSPPSLKNRPPTEGLVIIYRVLDGPTGQVVALGHGWLPIGKNRDKDIRAFANLIAW